MITVIMAGGKGTRIASVNADVPKPMIKVLGKPILEYQIESLHNQGCNEIILIIGHLGSVIKDYFGNGTKFGVSISYIVEEMPLGTAGALYYLKDKITEDFLLINGDIIFDIDIHRFMEYHRQKNAIATLFAHPNSHPYDSALLVTDSDGCVKKWLNKEDERGWYHNCVNAGIHVLSPSLLNSFTEAKKTDLDREVIKPLLGTGSLYAYESPEYVKDMGTPDRLFMVEKDLQNGLVQSKNLIQKQRAIFLDRDGTINKYVDFLNDINMFELINGVSEAVRRINEAGYLAIVITNQPVIARGEASVEEINDIHQKMETLLGQDGAYLDAIYYCPHHPDRGFEGERVEYKVECTCRKPKPGMILQAAQRYNISIENSWMIGDGSHDILAGINAGCKTALINPKGNDLGLNADIIKSNLLECVKCIIN